VGVFSPRLTALDLVTIDTWGDYREALFMSVHYRTDGTSAVLASVVLFSTFRAGSNPKPLRFLE
jgi:hypothetical protein